MSNLKLAADTLRAVREAHHSYTQRLDNFIDQMQRALNEQAEESNFPVGVRSSVTTSTAENTSGRDGVLKLRLPTGDQEVTEIEIPFSLKQKSRNIYTMSAFEEERDMGHGAESVQWLLGQLVTYWALEKEAFIGGTPSTTFN